MRFRTLCGVITGLGALVFLVANTLILGRFGIKSGQDEVEQIINAGVAGTVPTMLAMMPFIIAVTWKPGHWGMTRTGKRKWRRGRPNPIIVVGLALYAVFVAFNFMGAIGSIAYQKETFAETRSGQKDDAGRWKEARARALDQLKKLGIDKPKSALEADLEATKLHRFWRATDECAPNEVRSKAHRNFCAEVGRIRSSVQSAGVADKLRDEIADLEQKLASPAAHIGSVDPQSEVLAKYANYIMARNDIDAAAVRIFQPIMWFLLLEMSCMFLLYVTFKFFRVSHVDLFDDVMPHAVVAALPGPSRIQRLHAEPTPEPRSGSVAAMLSSLGGEDPDLQMAVYERFWADCTRSMPGGRESLPSLYAAYRSYCAQPSNSVSPYAYADFARRAADKIENVSRTNTGIWALGIQISEPMGAQS